MPLYLRVGLGPLRYSHRLTGRRRSPYVPIGAAGMAVVCILAGSLCLVLGMPWWVVAVVLLAAVVRNAAARR